MATLTAFEPRPYVLPRQVAEIELVQALPDDLKVFSPFYQRDVLRVGMVYWLQSSVTGKIEPTPRKLTDNCNQDEIKEWLQLKMIWIAKEPFN